MALVAAPDPSLTVLVGIPASGKSSTAARFWTPPETVAIDGCRQMVGPGSRQDWEAHELFYTWITCRLTVGNRVVADATCLQPYKRRRLRELARHHGVPCCCVIVEVDLPEAQRRNAMRDHPINPAHIEACYAKWVKAQHEVMAEGYDEVWRVVT